MPFSGLSLRSILFVPMCGMSGVCFFQNLVFSKTVLGVSNLCEMTAVRFIFSLFPNFTRSLMINPAACACIKPVPEKPAAVKSRGSRSSTTGR